MAQATEAHVSGEELAEKPQKYCRDHLAGYKVSRSIDFEDALPRHLTIKPYKRLLRNRYRKGRDRKI